MTKQQERICTWLLNKPGYLKTSAYKLHKMIGPKGTVLDYVVALKQARKEHKKLSLEEYHDAPTKVKPFKDTAWTRKMLDMYAFKEPSKSYPSIITSTKLDPNNVIWIPDLHAPFIRKGVLEFIKENQLRYKCGTVRFAGDIIDGHAWNYHEHDPDGMSVGDELEAAREQLKPWFKAFPEATVCMGNHDLLIQRKAKTIGLSKHFIKDFGQVIGAPKTWEFGLEFRQDNVIYKHGNVGDAFKVAKDSRMSTCQGHFHAKTFVQWSVSEKDSIFGMQIGWGADRDSYAFDYGKSFAAKPIISLGVVLDRGRTPIVKLMDL